MAKDRVLTFDVGGSHVSAAVCTRDYQLGPVATAHHDSIETSDGFIELLVRLGAEAAQSQNGHVGPAAATLAVPGPFDLEAGISEMHHKLPYLFGVDLRQALAPRFGCRTEDVRFLNDADAYLLGEVGAGAARGFSRAIALTLGTGIGSAFAVNGKVVTEGAGVPKDGEIWNLAYEGKTVEDFVSARAITAAYARRTGKTCSAADIAAAAPDDAAAREALAEFGTHLGCVIATVLAGFRADVIVLGGGIAGSSSWFLPALEERLPSQAPELRIAQLEDRAPLVGCGVAWFEGDNFDGGNVEAVSETVADDAAPAGAAVASD
jgi:glucokinase